MSILRKPIIVNLFAGPGTGKSTVAAQVFSELKWKGVICELVTEYAKEIVYEGSDEKLKDQENVFKEQKKRMDRLKGKVDVIITDSPILFSLIYGKDRPEEFVCKVRNEHFDNWNINFFLKRKKPYIQIGRVQDESGALEKDEEILNMLNDLSEQYIVVDATKNDTNNTIIPFIVQTLQIIKTHGENSI